MKEGSPVRRKGSSPKTSDARTISLSPSSDDGGAPLALYVTGPRGGRRHLVPRGALIRIGRGGDSAIVLDDPRASRSHAALHLGEPITLSDLQSANGTFVAGRRLAPGEAREIAFNETFVIGDSAVVLRPSGLAAIAPARLIGADEVGRRVKQAGRGFVILKARASRPGEGRWIEPILGELLASPADWLLRLGGEETVVGIAAASMADLQRLERAALQRLAGWNVDATVDASFLSASDSNEAADTAIDLLGGGGVPSLPRGAVVLRAPAMLELQRILQRVAPAPVTVLVLGETGVGKDVVASLVHEMSPRAKMPLVRLNCASLPEQLLESELFGHERGAFTGAVATRIGLLEGADGGTVFLDEVGELLPVLQPKLLRVMESNEVVRIGGLRPRAIDVRFVAATNRDLAADVERGRFRRDLFHRLNVVTVTVPPLRERREEIAPLARHFLNGARARFDVGPFDLSPSAMAALEAYPWPGNVRELRNVIERSALLASGPSLEPHHFNLPPVEATVMRSPTVAVRHLADSEGPERVWIEEALNRCGGNQSRAAEMLGIPRRTLVRRIAQLAIPRPHRPTD